MRLGYEISRWFEGEYRAYIEDRQMYERLVRRKGCCHHAVYWLPDGSLAWDIIVTADDIDRVREILQSVHAARAAKTAPRTRKVAAKRGLNDKDLRGAESP